MVNLIAVTTLLLTVRFTLLVAKNILKEYKLFLSCLISISLAILSEIFIQTGYFFLRVMRENKSGCFFLNTVYNSIPVHIARVAHALILRSVFHH